jgi:nicotinamide phosphoribosyltransferase
MFTIENTLPEFAWLVGYLEPQLSSYCWGPMTSATIANNYYRILHKYAELTGDPKKCFMQAGDFSMRGMMAPEAAYRTSAGHLLSFGISSTVSTRGYLKAYYHADDHVVKYSPSTEHSVMCSYGRDEVYAFKHLITEVYPSGNVSIVSDTYDLWRVVDEVLPQLKDIILARKGKVVIRPDSGEPIDIICGDPKASSETIRKGIVQRLYEIFGGTINSKGFIELDPHIGVVYGDSITIDRCEKICQGLYEKGFATTNVSLGIGSYTYQYQTRDTFGFALKATAIEIYCSFRAIYKDPATDKDSFKRSQRGLVVVVKDEDGDFKLIDGLNNETIIQYKDVNLLKDFYEDGEFHYTQTFDEIRARVASESERVYGGKVEEI